MDPSKDKEDIIPDDTTTASRQVVAEAISKASSAAVELTLDNESKASHAATPTLVADIIRKASSTAMDVTLANDKSMEQITTAAAVDSLDDGEDYLSLSLDGSSMTMAEPSQTEDAGIETEPPPVQSEEDDLVLPLTTTTTMANGGIDAELSTQLDGEFSTVSIVPSNLLGPLPSDSISTFGGGVNGTLESDSDLIENIVAATMSETEKLILDPLPEPVVAMNVDEQPLPEQQPLPEKQPLPEQQPPDEEEKTSYNDETFDTLSPIKTTDKGNREEGLSGNNNNNNDDNDNDNNDSINPSRENIRTADSELAYGEEEFEESSAPPRYTHAAPPPH